MIPSIGIRIFSQRLKFRRKSGVSRSSDTRLLNKWLNNELLLKLDSLNYNTLQALLLWLTNTSALQTWHLLTKYTCTHLTSRYLHTLALDSISLYTLAIYGTHYTSYNFTPLSLGALWHSSLHTLHKSLTHLTSLTHSFTYHHIYLY